MFTDLVFAEQEINKQKMTATKCTLIFLSSLIFTREMYNKLIKQEKTPK